MTPPTPGFLTGEVRKMLLPLSKAGTLVLSLRALVLQDQQPQHHLGTWERGGFSDPHRPTEFPALGVARALQVNLKCENPVLGPLPVSLSQEEIGPLLGFLLGSCGLSLYTRCHGQPLLTYPGLGP
jgi:hypothetical protein